MPDPSHPLLFLPGGRRRVRPTGNFPRKKPLRLPGRDRQAERLDPAFDRLQTALDERRVQLRTTADGAEPELVLVFEVATSIARLVDAVRKVGLEWLAEIGEVELDEDEDFGPEKAGGTFRGSVYLLLTDQAALRQLLSLWRTWKRTGQVPTGFTPFRDVFVHLLEVRPWGASDRVRETGLNERIDGLLPHQEMDIEVELWFRAAGPSAAARGRVTAAVEDVGGQVLDQRRLPEIQYDGMLVRLPSHEAARLVDAQPDVRLALLDDIMYLRPVPQSLPARSDEAGPPADAPADQPDPELLPTVILLDGVPQANHPDLAGRIVLDDPDGLEAQYAVEERQHGTAMASLVVHGDLSAPGTPLRRRILSHPIMVPDPDDLGTPRQERFPKGRLPVDVLHEAIVRGIDADPSGGRKRPDLRIVNLSIGDAARVYAQTLSPLARLIDWAAHRFGLLVVVSAGNDPSPLDLGCTNAELAAFDTEEVQDRVVALIERDARIRRLLAPAESMNAVTVGAAADDAGPVQPNDPRRDPVVGTALAAPYSRLGGGHRRSIKPDLINAGGRLRYREATIAQADPAILLAPQNSLSARGPGLLAAAPGPRADRLYGCGTSHAAALTTRHAAILLENLLAMDDRPGWLTDPVVVPLLRAMVVHGAEWGDALTLAVRALRDTTRAKRLLERTVGHGRLRPDVMSAFDRSRVVLLGGGALAPGEAADHNVPLPSGLSGLIGERRLRVTLAWLSAMNGRHQRYRGVRMTLDHAGGAPLADLVNLGTDRNAARRGTLEHHVWTSDAAVPLGPEAALAFRVDCASEAVTSNEAVPYGLVVSLEVSPALGVPVYEQISERLRQPVAVRVPVSPGDAAQRRGSTRT